MSKLAFLSLFSLSIACSSQQSQVRKGGPAPTVRLVMAENACKSDGQVTAADLCNEVKQAMGSALSGAGFKVSDAETGNDLVAKVRATLKGDKQLTLQVSVDAGDR